MNGLHDEFAGVLRIEQLNADSDETKTLMREIGVRGHPSYAIIDADRQLLWSAAGQVDAEVLRQVIEQYGK